MDSGVAVLIKKDIPHTFHTDTFSNNILAATIQTKQGKMKIITFYRPPRQKDLPLMDINNLVDHNIPTLILADANSKHVNFGHNSTDSTGKLLNSFINSTDIHYIGPDFSTFHENNKSGISDIILANSKFLTMAHHIQEGDRLPCSKLKIFYKYKKTDNIYKHNLTPQNVQILNNIKQHINSSAAEDTCSFWSRKMD